MRAYKRYHRGGFTLVELMIVVAIIGVLAALAIYGVRRYLQSAKTSEAKNSIGAISRGAVGAYERESTAQELLAEGTTASAFSHDVCAQSTNVPSVATNVQGRKYQPLSDPGADFETGDERSGWKCLKFTVTNPVYFIYGYQGIRQDSYAGTGATAITAPISGTVAGAAGTGNVLAYAQGNLDGDTAYSFFGQRGQVGTNKTFRLATEVQVVDEFE